MAIKKANELDFSNKKFTGLVCGRPGTGKTTLCESASRPLLIDLEKGIARVEAVYRKDSSQLEDGVADKDKYASFLADLTPENLKDYDTIIVDSLGKLVEILTPCVISENPQNGQKDGKTLSLKGYGAIKAKLKEFKSLLESLNKDVLYTCHTTETNDGETVKTRLLLSGSTKDDIWDDVDFGGYLEIVGKNRVIHFAPSDKWDAKKTQGILDEYTLDNLKDTASGGKEEDNKFFTILFNNLRHNLTVQQKAVDSNKAIYDEAMKLVPEILACKNAEDLNNVTKKFSEIKHGLTSKEELSSKLKAKANELKNVVKYNKETKAFEDIKEEAKNDSEAGTSGSTPKENA